MYDHGKSDSSILPEKLPNKASGAPRPAEEVEERGLAKGNLVQQNRVRTQWREALRRALEWIRQAVSACASEPEVGAQCGSSARWDLCGGCRVTGIPTATNRTLEFPYSLSSCEIGATIGFCGSVILCERQLLHWTNLTCFTAVSAGTLSPSTI